MLVDDSIVRGSTTRQLVQMVRDAGATEVHLRISSPPYRWPCFYGMDTGDRSTLLAADRSVDEIVEFLDVDSLAYLELDRLRDGDRGRPRRVLHGVPVRRLPDGGAGDRRQVLAGDVVATYREAGVDLEAADRVVREHLGRVTATWGPDVVGGFGGFAAGIRLPAGYEQPVLMMSTDGVGTKAEVARRAGKLDGLGYDLVAMCIDDLVAAGATPIAMTDYLAVGRIDVEMVTAWWRPSPPPAQPPDVALLGGETAEHPGVMDAGCLRPGRCCPRRRRARP